MGRVVAPTLAVALLLAAAVVREPAVPRAEELVGLAQTGGGLALHAPKWDLGGRLSDQIKKWSQDGSGGEGARLKAAGPGFVPAAGTQQLAQVGAGGAAALSHKIKTAVDTLRLSDFLTGVKPKTVHLQVQALLPTLPVESVAHELQMRSLPELDNLHK